LTLTFAFVQKILQIQEFYVALQMQMVAEAHTQTAETDVVVLLAKFAIQKMDLVVLLIKTIA
jgi:hypothetical protein